MKKTSPKQRTTKRTRIRSQSSRKPKPKTIAESAQQNPLLGINNILVPIDFSGHSRNALRYAIPMANQYDATLHLLYVVEPTVYPADLGFGQVVMPGIENELRAKGQSELYNLIETEIGGKVRSESVVRTGKPHQEILNEVKEKNIDLIIMATHGHTGVEHMLFGSTAMRVVRLAPCPVLTIRPQAG